MHTPVARGGYRLTEDDFTHQDLVEFQQLVTDLLTACTSIGARHAPDGSWTPRARGVFEEFAESMQVLADLSRALNKTRRGIRRINGRARERLHERHPAPVSPHSGTS
jgi:tRNA U34 5-carboxymethylaminomethyl modifying GTPase MnmE/TrmE